MGKCLLKLLKSNFVDAFTSESVTSHLTLFSENLIEEGVDHLLPVIGLSLPPLLEDGGKVGIRGVRAEDILGVLEHGQIDILSLSRK